MRADRETDIEVLFDDRQVIIGRANSKWARRRGLQLRDIVSERWFLPPVNSAIGLHISECFRAAGLEPPTASVTSFSIPLCLRMVEKEDFLAMLPVSMLMQGEHLRLRLLRVEAPHVPRPTGIVSLKNRTLGPLAQLFVASARKLASALSSGVRSL
jgi:DNA-binding transcriptional LysR family regulator